MISKRDKLKALGLLGRNKFSDDYINTLYQKLVLKKNKEFGRD